MKLCKTALCNFYIKFQLIFNTTGMSHLGKKIKWSSSGGQINCVLCYRVKTNNLFIHSKCCLAGHEDLLGSRVVAMCVLNFGTGYRSVVLDCCFSPGERASIPAEQEAKWSSDPFWKFLRKAKTFALAGNRKTYLPTPNLIKTHIVQPLT